MDEVTYRTYPRFYVYKTYDLENFFEPKVVVDCEGTDFWADLEFWGSKVFFYKGKYYLFCGVRSESRNRAIHIFVCDTPDGKFEPLTPEPITPPDWVCLESILYIEDGVPYAVFSHEWVQVRDGEICAMPLSDDLTHAIGEPVVLFRASENVNVTPTGKNKDGYVTDECFLFREDGKLRMIWSSFHEGKYVVLEAESDNGSIHGKWIQGKMVFDFEGAGAMLFHRLDGTRMMALHSPNKRPLERAYFYEY